MGRRSRRFLVSNGVAARSDAWADLSGTPRMREIGGTAGHRTRGLSIYFRSNFISRTADCGCQPGSA
jgi:hypothetical protein